ncbi:hypothetical protein [Aquimarina pacifica]|uniref:hypothetical protein n=1 Tax=Aquimarina pacifica TaxID=1296415 RepID=UPI00046E839E|nr:hypothetical protein [Aquimarina pacifica]
MKKQLYTLGISILLVGCSGSKETVQSNYDPANNPYYVKKTHQAKGTKEIDTPELSKKINSIIADYLGVPMNAIARSPITQTKTGYQWKFMNVKTGSSFSASSDFNFSSVKISKNSGVSNL